jgi:hypothetical protein
VWQGTTEVGESERLLGWLKRNVSSARDAPVDNFFYDVQGLAATQPMVIRCEDDDGSLKLSGVPDLAILAEGLDDEVVSPFDNALVLVDWKTTTAAEKLKASFQVQAQAVAFMDYAGFGGPAFLTDLVTGFRGWMVVDSTLFSFHPRGEWLTLNQGVSLIRYFVDRGRMTHADKIQLVGGSAHTGGSRNGDGGGDGIDREGGEGDASGDVDASRGGRQSPLGRAGVSAATPSAGSTKRSSRAAGYTASSPTPETETEKSSPQEILDAAQLAAYREVHIAEFAAKVQCAARVLGQSF